MINIPKGTKDMLPSEAYKWHYVESVARSTAAKFGFKEIRTPMFEHTELFLRGVGETTDIVNKEMYTFLDKGGRSMTLRPEGTAGVARCFIENGLSQGVMPMKAYYIASVFRYEKPQNGRLREHHQFGVECYGSDSPSADAEVISLAATFLKNAGLESLELNLNSIGCPECRAKFNAALKEYIGANLSGMCGQCQTRFEKNPLRILDCKEEKCKVITAGAPKITDYLCDDCKAHFEKVQDLLTKQGIAFKVNPSIVRGLDYYTRTVFEFVSTDIGAQGTVCGGGRYNNLVEEVGGKPTPAVGFGLGLERLLLVLENTGRLSAERECTDLYILPIGEAASEYARTLAMNLRAQGVSVETDIMDRGVKSQMKYADKSGARYVV
ncbi:MAG: histidine--tRNA ligase, partial [Clostridia bacterium]|nr:histidine--tRNA ligase [Clostridia bacterium]